MYAYKKLNPKAELKRSLLRASCADPMLPLGQPAAGGGRLGVFPFLIFVALVGLEVGGGGAGDIAG